MADSDTPTSPDLFAGATISRLLNITERRLRQLAAEGVIPKADRGRYPLAATVRGYVIYLQQTGSTENIDPDKLEPFKRRAHYQAEVEKLALGVKSGELIPRAEVEREFARIYDVIARFLDVLPDRLERAGMVDPQAAERIVLWSNQARIELHSEIVPTEDSPAASA